MVQSVCVCGSGTMGRGIAQVAAQSSLPVVLYDVSRESLDRAASALQADLQALADRKKISPEEQAAIAGRVRFTNDLDDCIADIVIEAIVEKPAVKVELFNQLAKLNPGETIFATNTSSLSVTELVAQIIHPARVAGMHFFNPAPLMKLVEVVSTPYTAPATTETIVALARQMGKTPVLCKDAPGFIVNHVARPYYLEALKLAEQGIADMETIDSLLEATGFRMGPFKLMDLIGNDINYAVSCSVYEQLGSPLRLQPSPIQAEKVSKGELGRKTGKGYYQYS